MKALLKALLTNRALLLSVLLTGCAIAAKAQTTSSMQAASTSSAAVPTASTASAAVKVSREAPLMAPDPELEARLLNISQELRCLVCQNESLASSHAELAEDLRHEVRELLRSGKTDQAIKEFLLARYGDFVLYRPEVKPLTWVLWFGPFLLLILAVWVLSLYLRQRQVVNAPVDLNDEQRQRAKQLLKG